MKNHRIAPKRTIVHSILIFLYFFLPLVSIQGNPLFRIDIIKRTIYLFSIPVRVDQLYIILFASLLAVSLFLLLTVLLGRVWCGWLCPQTIMNDIAGYFSKKLKNLLPKSIGGIAIYLTSFIISALFAFSSLTWFISPQNLFNSLLGFTLHPLVSISFLTIFLILYFDLVLVGRGFCKTLCPYGRFQVALQDYGTLNLAMVEETRNECIKCGSCVRACPMGIDIREGFQVECINCGRCIDACRNVMGKRKFPQGLIAYRFGIYSGSSPHFGFKSTLLGALVVFLTIALVLGVTGRSDNAFSLQRNPLVDLKTTSDGYQIQAWRAIIGNRSENSANYSIRFSGSDLILLGPVENINLRYNENTTVSFFLRFKPQKDRTYKLQLFRNGVPVSQSTVTP